MTEYQAWQKAMEDLQAYDEECTKHNKAILKQIATKLGNKAIADFKNLLDFANVRDKLEIVSKPDGENQNEECGVFTEVRVDQWSVGMEGDSFEGFIYGKFANMEWIKIPYSC